MKTQVVGDMARHPPMATKRKSVEVSVPPASIPPQRTRRGRDRISSVGSKGHPLPTCRNPRTGESPDPASENGVGGDLVWG